MNLVRNILIACIVTAGTAAAAAADGARPMTKAPAGSIAAQIQLKLELIRLNSGQTLAASILHNRAEWESLSPDRREHFRQEYLAFRQKSPQEQAELLEKFEKLIHLDARRQEAYRQRARWLQAVVDSLSAEQRAEISRMAPKERAKALLARRDELVREGKLKLEEKDAPQEPAEKETQDSPMQDAQTE